MKPLCYGRCDEENRGDGGLIRPIRIVLGLNGASGPIRVYPCQSAPRNLLWDETLEKMCMMHQPGPDQGSHDCEIAPAVAEAFLAATNFLDPRAIPHGD